MNHIIRLIGLIAASAQAMSEPLPAELVGTWNVVPSSVQALGLPSACQSIRMRFEADGDVHYASGELEYKARVTAKRDGIGHQIVQEPYENNGRPNCQGRSAEHFFSHYSSTSYVETKGSVMRIYLFGKEKPVVLSYERK